ncbi:hypothetical protein JHK82_012328 [Glycine max]|uniref:Uncharacterized protein n=2 Tax=Glycine subgen. Soja TaxID=1462606 RepID=A0A0R0JSD8_SOYBN|nr:hypothetical protein JHK87_012242 [Glycine soja]KAG5040210.1 hypothetical protein JHK85_012686 [Glycine max]KAG5057349.1 hypothetical protein JHK86_012345 [Glycine max]KAG5154359.1 hypothetical protein JHK82_012328 [Glycine max]KAH1133534.1 hypothetical protein GYH30_012080 [Glycine max]
MVAELPQQMLEVSTFVTLVADDNSSVSIKLIRRQVIVVVHSLARAATSKATPHFYYLVPTCIDASTTMKMI